jgi:hypothetical protein
MIINPNKSPVMNSLRCPNVLPRIARYPSKVDLWLIPWGTPERWITVPEDETLPRKRQAQREPSPISLDQVHRIVGPTHGHIPNLQMQMGSLVTGRTDWGTNQSDRITAVETLTDLQRWPFEEMPVEGTVTVRMSENEIMRTSSVWTIDRNDNALTDRPYHGAAPCGEIDTEVESLSTSIQNALVPVCGHRVPVPLGDEPCRQSWRLSER